MIFVKDPCVLVVGAGPVGLTLAADLLRRGVSCRVIDRSDGPPRWSKASLLQARTLELLDDLGLAEEAVHRGRRLHGMGLYGEGERLAHWRFEGMETPYPFVLGLSQHEIERLLEGLLTRLGVTVERAVRLDGFTQDQGLVTARLSHRDGRAETVQTPWLVGCDGAFSTVRAGLGLAFEGEDYGQVMLQGDLRIRWPGPVPDDEALVFFSSAGALAALPLHHGDRWRLLALQPQGADVEPSLDNFQALLRARGPHGAELSEPDWLAGFPLRRRLAPAFRVGRVFLAGDAAHLQSPVSGQGMNLGMQDAYNLGWKLGLVARGEAAPQLLDSYEEERLPEAADAIETADELTKIFASFMSMPGAEALAVRENFFSILALQKDFPRRLSRAAGMLTASYRSTLIGEYCGWDSLPGPAAESAGAGSFYDFGAAPQPGDHAPDAPLASPVEGKRRLRHLLHGPYHTLLIFPGEEDYDGAEALWATAAEVAALHAARVRTFVVVPSQHRPPDVPLEAAIVLDAGGAIHRLYGARRECLYLIRPDEYIGFRGHPARSGPLLAYLDRLLGREQMEPSLAQRAVLS